MALLFHGVSGLVVVLGSEAAVFHFDLSDQFGFMPILTRGVLYLLLTTLLWASLLKGNRSAITALLEEHRDFYESLPLAHDNALSLKDPRAGGHGHRVARYVHLIAGAIGLHTSGADILRAIPSLRRLAIAVRHHHERFDGSGYPDRLQGMMIPLASRIIAVADTFDALTANRSYRKGLPPHEALGELVKDAGSRLDPDIVSMIARRPLRDALCTMHGEMA